MWQVLIPVGVGAAIWLWPKKVVARGPDAGLVARGNVSSVFGPRGPEGVHAGVDIAAPEGTEIRAARDGVIVDMSPDGLRDGYGNLLLLEHADGTVSLYAHMKKFGPGLKVGKAIAAGTVVGYVGNTQAPKTKPMKPHLHYEVLQGYNTWKGRIVVNPSSPSRLEPQAWLRKYNRPIADA